MGLFSGRVIFRGAYYWREFCVSKWVAFDNKNSLKQFTPANPDSPWAYHDLRGLFLNGFLQLRFRRLIFRGAFFWNFLVF